MNLKSRTFKIAPLLLITCLVGCATIDNRGHDVQPEQLAKIKVGVTTKEQIAELLGTPSSVSTFGNKTWIYMSEVTKRRAFFTPHVLKSNVTRIEFDEQGKVKSLDSLTEKDKQVVFHIQRTTPTSGHTFGVLEQIFGNVGRFNGKDPDNDKPGR
ncbi:MAG: outer membrane protein assembly factor BamE [Proteobacteria bacterium]|nr:outer membrane protein assembly factor BamE [Pseudomonadota bacterium]